MQKYCYFIQFFVVLFSVGLSTNVKNISNQSEILVLNKTLLINKLFDKIIFGEKFITLKILEKAKIQIINSKNVKLVNKIIITTENLQNFIILKNSSFIFKVIYFKIFKIYKYFSFYRILQLKTRYIKRLIYL